MRPTKDSLKELFTALSPPGTVTSPRLPFSARSDDDDDVSDEDERRSVREWMEKKKTERMKEFRQKLRELRDAEKHPFKPSNKTTKQVRAAALLFVVLRHHYHGGICCVVVIQGSYKPGRPRKEWLDNVKEWCIMDTYMESRWSIAGQRIMGRNLGSISGRQRSLSLGLPEPDLLLTSALVRGDNTELLKRCRVRLSRHRRFQSVVFFL